MSTWDDVAEMDQQPASDPWAAVADFDEAGSPESAILGHAVQKLRSAAPDSEARKASGFLNRAVYAAERWPVAGGMLRAGYDAMVVRSAMRIRDGKGSPEDYSGVANYLVQAEEAGNRSFGGQVFDVLTQIPGFAIEVALTGGAYSGGKKAAQKVVGEAAQSLAGKVVQATLPRAVGVAAQTAANPQLVARSTAQRLIPDIKQTVDDQGNVVSVDIGEDKSFLSALGQGFVDAGIELGTERAGGHLAKGAGKLAGFVPGAQKVQALKAAVSQKWLAAKPGRTFAMLDDALKAGGWNGVVGEVMEERAGDVARLVTGLQGPEENVTGQLATGRFAEAGRQLGVEAAAFSVPGAVNIGARRLAQLKTIRAKGYVSAEDGQTAGVPGETRRERLANADAEIQQLEQEIQNAVPEREAEAIPPREAPVPSEEMGQQVRVQDREEEVATAPEEVLKSRELLDWLAQAEAAAPEVQQEPAAERRDMPPDAGPMTMEEVQAIVEQGVPAHKPLQPKKLPEIEIGPEGETVEQPKKKEPPIVEYRKQAATISESLPPPAEGFTRLWRGNRPGETGKNPQFTNSLEGIALPFQKSYGGDLSYVDVSTADLPKYEQRGGAAPGAEFVVTPEIAAAAQVVGKSTETIPPSAPPKRTGRKQAPPPELAQAGITIKSTPKGWSVTGIPKEIADGLSIDYQGKRAGKGYFFRKDPTPGLVDAAGKIAAEAELDAAARAQGRRRTSIGHLEEESAVAFEQARSERLKVEKERIAERNAGVEQLLQQFVPKGSRGKFKLKLLRAAEEGDADTVKRFDEMVQYAKDNPEIGLTGNETELFALLTGESFVQNDDDLLEKIDAELAAELEAELGDTSFDFGENAPEVKQAAIPGTEEAVERAGRREDVQRAKEEFRKEATSTRGKQKAFISGIGTDSPGQLTAFDVDGLDGGEDEGGPPAKPEPPTKPPEPSKTKLQEAADAATKDAFDELDAFGKMLKGKGLPSNPMLDPEVIAGAARVVAKFAKAGTLKFAAVIEHLVSKLGQAAVDRIRPALEAEWDRMQKSGEVSGMEPRTPEAQAEPVPPSGDDLTSIKKAVVNEMREMVGLPEMEGSTPQSVEQWAETARVTLANDPKAALRLVNELAGKTARPISQHDAMLLQFRYRQLANELEPVVDEYFEAVKSEDPVKIATARTAVINARKAMTDFEETIHPSKETWGRTGVALQQMMRKDFSVEAVLRRGQESNNGEELSPDQTAELTKLSQKLEDLQKRFDEQRRKTEELEAELASKSQHEETVTKAKREKVYRKSDRRQAAEKKVSDAWAKFRSAAGSQAGAGTHLLGPAVELAQAYVELGYVRFGEFMAAVRKNVKDADEKLFRQAWDQVAPASDVDLTDRSSLTREARRIQRTLVELGMTDREQVIDAVHESLKEELPDLTRRQTMDALSRYGQFQAQSQDEIEKLIRGMNSEILKLSQIDQIEKAMKRVDELRAQGKTDEEIGKALADEKLLVEATGLVRDRPSQTVRQLTQKYSELKNALPATPTAKAGLLQTALGQIERALANRIQDLRWEIENGEKIVREKRERPTSERIKALEAERDALVKIHREMFPPKKKTLTEAARLQSAVKAADRAIEQLEKQLETGDFDRETRAPLSSPELDSRRARLAQLRAAREAAKALEAARMEGEGGKPSGLSDAELARRVYEATLRKKIADYQQTLKEGDFSPKPKRGPRELSSSELRLKREMEDVRHKVLEKYAEYHLSHLQGIAWTADKIAEAAHLSRALMTTFDLSLLLRQGGLASMGHPVLAKRALFETVASIARTFDRESVGKDFKWSDIERFLTGIDSRQAEFDLMHKLTQGTEGEFRLRAGLALPTTDQSITKQEEAFQGRWGKLVPGVALTSRLNIMVLNKLRADLFDSMVQNLGRGGKVTMDEAKIIAEFVNVSTGRSDLGKFNGWASALNTVFFAPRYVASRFQYLAMPFYLPFQGGSWRVKRAILQEYGRTAAGIGTVLGTFALLGMLLYDDDDDDRPRIETDPRSSDFLKVRIGETRLDFLSGLSQVIVLSSRMISGQTKSGVSGKVRNFGEGYKPETRASTLARFGRTKLAPVPGAIATIADDWTNVVGQKETPLSMAGSLVLPLSLKDVSTTMKAQGIPKGTAMSMLSILGVGMNTYGPKTQYMTGSPEERQAQIENDLKTLAWDSPEPAYGEFLTEEQLAQFGQRRLEKRGLVVYNATYSGSNEEELKTRDKNLEQLDAMGVSMEDAQQLLKDYYRRPDEKGRPGRITEGYFPRVRELKRIYKRP